jgi:phosphotransferase system enzyme I (PtsP)
VRDGDQLLLDGDQGVIDVRPAPSLVEAFEARFAKNRERQAHYATMRDVEPITRDGQRITVMINAGLRDDMPMLPLTGADGIGLFRTEFQFLVSATMPQRERQTRLYRDVLEAAGIARWCSARSISAETRCCPICATTRARPRKTRRWAGARCAWRWSATAC